MADAEVADDPADGEPLGDEPIGETKVEETQIEETRTEETQTGRAQGSKALWHQTIPESVARVAVIGLVVVLGLGALCGWLGYRVHSQGRAERDRALFLEVGKQAAVNLTTIDYQTAEADVERILDSATGAFRDEFSGRADPYVDVVKKAQSVSSGIVTEAGVETMSAEEGQVLVAVTVQTTNRVVTEPQPPRYWRMKLTVSKVGNGAKISKVDFVS
ncbi:MAG: Mce protein [Mycobacterium sp.]